MINLYIFNETSRASVYGIGTYIRELTVALKKSNINPCVIHLYSEKENMEIDEMDEIRHWYIPAPLNQRTALGLKKKNSLYYCNILYLLQLEIKDVTNLVFHLNYNTNGMLAKKLKKAFDCRIITTVHYLEWSFSLFGNTSYFKRILTIPEIEHINNIQKSTIESYQREKELFQTVNHIICLSKNTQHILQYNYQIEPDKISVIYNGLTDINIELDKSLLRKKYRLPDIPTLFFVGRVDDTKGLKYALRAFKIVLKTFPDCHFIVTGDGDLNSHMIECEDIWMNVTWTGLISKEKLYELYTMADIGILPSFHEQCSYVAIEMMMHGLPIIGSTSTGLCEMVENNVTGLHIPVIEHVDRAEIDSSLLAEKILYLLQHPTESKQMGQNGRRRYLHNYSSKIFRINMLEAYKSVCQCREENKIKTLIVTGQNNHRWEVSHVAIKQILENSGLFTVNVAVSPEAGKIMSNFRPDFASHQLVVLDYCGDRWPEETEKSFLNFVEKGGGVVIYHAANNAFRHWKKYNRIIGFGGWGNRDETDGPYIYLRDDELVYDEESPGRGGSHGSQHEFTLNCGNPDHPVTKGLPARWRHAQDELYDRMRGPGIVKDVLYWAHSDSATKGSGRDEIAMFTVDYGRAHIFHTTLGHTGNTPDNNVAMQCAGFQVTLLRGAEWAATGKVSQKVPDDFPTETTISLRKKYK